MKKKEMEVYLAYSFGSWLPNSTVLALAPMQEPRLCNVMADGYMVEACARGMVRRQPERDWAGTKLALLPKASWEN
jgi:hypothetical protein